MPPLAGPRLMLCCTRNPVYRCTEPSSWRTGKWTVSSRLTSRRRRRVSSGRPRTSAAASKRRCAMAKADLGWSSTAMCNASLPAGWGPNPDIVVRRVRPPTQSPRGRGLAETRGERTLGRGPGGLGLALARLRRPAPAGHLLPGPGQPALEVVHPGAEGVEVPAGGDGESVQRPVDGEVDQLLQVQATPFHRAGDQGRRTAQRPPQVVEQGLPSLLQPLTGALGGLSLLLGGDDLGEHQRGDVATGVALDDLDVVALLDQPGDPLQRDVAAGPRVIQLAVGVLLDQVALPGHVTPSITHCVMGRGPGPGPSPPGAGPGARGRCCRR